MLEKLKKLQERYIEIEQLLSSPEAHSDREKSNKLAKELSDLKEPVSLFREHSRISKEIREMEVVLGEKHDKEFLELAKKELDELKIKLKETEEKMKEAFIEKDKDAGRDIIIEIRQGTSGDEAGLFAADLYRIYKK